MILSARVEIILLIVHFCFKTKIETAEFRRWHKDLQVAQCTRQDLISVRQREATKSINLSYPYS